ncbi:MAG: hypothetical protein MZV70_03340 [Desulfobacterales bacterium]|nr:hypothetical protein [Desulfobacterales bacterium]
MAQVDSAMQPPQNGQGFTLGSFILPDAATIRREVAAVSNTAHSSPATAAVSARYHHYEHHGDKPSYQDERADDGLECRAGVSHGRGRRCACTHGRRAYLSSAFTCHAALP